MIINCVDVLFGQLFALFPGFPHEKQIFLGFRFTIFWGPVPDVCLFVCLWVSSLLFWLFGWFLGFELTPGNLNFLKEARVFRMFSTPVAFPGAIPVQQDLVRFV